MRLLGRSPWTCMAGGLNGAEILKENIASLPPASIAGLSFLAGYLPECNGETRVESRLLEALFFLGRQLRILIGKSF